MVRRTYYDVWSRSNHVGRRRRIGKVLWLVGQCSWTSCNFIKGSTICRRKTSKQRDQTQRHRFQWALSAIQPRHYSCLPIQKSAQQLKHITQQCLDNISHLTRKVIQLLEPVHYTSSRNKPMTHRHTAARWVKTRAVVLLKKSYRPSVVTSKRAKRNRKKRERTLTQRLLAQLVRRKSRIRRRNRARSFEAEVVLWIWAVTHRFIATISRRREYSGREAPLGMERRMIRRLRTSHWGRRVDRRCSGGTVSVPRRARSVISLMVKACHYVNWVVGKLRNWESWL